MKTKHKLFKLTSLFALLLTFLAFAPSAQAQPCPVIQNNLQCRISVKVEFYYPDAMGTCTKFCNSYVIGNINPGQTLPINCALCPQSCNIVVTVLTANGLPAAGAADFSTVAPLSNPVTGTSPCLTATARISYFPGFGFRLLP